MGGAKRGGTEELGIEYKPLPSQEAFHNSDARFKGFSGPIGSGKSQALCQEAIKLSYINSGRVGLIGAPTYPMLRDATQTSLIEALDRNGIAYDFNRAENFLVFRRTRSKIIFRAVEEFERLRGSNLAWFGLDELTYAPEDAWLRLEGRLRDPRAKRLCGFAVWTPKGFDWVYERFIARSVEGYFTVQAMPFENRYLLEKVPDYYDRLKKSYDSRFYQQEVLGEYLEMSSGRVYYAFSRLKHVGTVEIDPKLPLFWALDFNVEPMSSVVAQVVDGQVRVAAEIVLHRASTRDACEAFFDRFGGHRGEIIVYADASGHNLQTSGTSDLKIINDFARERAGASIQCRVAKSNPPVRERVALVNAKLESASGETQIVISPECGELIKDFEQVVYVEGSGMIDKAKDPRRTHLSDALGYLIWEKFRGPGKVGERGRRLL